MSVSVRSELYMAVQATAARSSRYCSGCFQTMSYLFGLFRNFIRMYLL